jgi:hypothetical protein
MPVVTGLARIGVDLPVIERIVNHASGSFRGIVSTYQKYSFEPETRKALDRWGQYIENLPRTIIARPVEAVARNYLRANNSAHYAVVLIQLRGASCRH